MKNNKKCALAIDFKEYEKEESQWLEEREIMRDLYRVFSEYIAFLEKKLSQENNDYQRYLIKQKIRNLRKEIKKYETKSILATAKYNLEEDEFDKSIQKPSFLTRKKTK